jgi:hypothetical protein
VAVALTSRLTGETREGGADAFATTCRAAPRRSIMGNGAPAARSVPDDFYAAGRGRASHLSSI